MADITVLKVRVLFFYVKFFWGGGSEEFFFNRLKLFDLPMTLFSDALIRDKTSDQVDKMVPLEIAINCVNSVQDHRNVLSAQRGQRYSCLWSQVFDNEKMCVIDSVWHRKLKMNIHHNAHSPHNIHIGTYKDIKTKKIKINI